MALQSGYLEISGKHLHYLHFPVFEREFQQFLVEILVVRWRLYLYCLKNLHQFYPHFERDFGLVEMVDVFSLFL
jgi:hypothetical protein